MYACCWANSAAQRGVAANEHLSWPLLQTPASQFAIERLARDAQFGGHLLPPASFWQDLAFGESGIETIRDPRQ
jgi:hypothetical protein